MSRFARPAYGAPPSPREPYQCSSCNETVSLDAPCACTRAFRRAEEKREALEAHMEKYRGFLLTARGAFPATEFDRLYLEWVRARWDAGDPWVKSVWKVRP